MKILLLDDEQLSLYGLSSAVRKADPYADVYEFQDPQEAVAFLDTISIDTAFLDIELRMDNGIEVAKKLTAKNPSMNIIFVTGYREYMEAAFSIHASGYVMKPVTAEKVRLELDNLRNPVADRKDNHIFVRTFGEFEVFRDDVPLQFSYAKTKELFAILIDAGGAMCTIGRIMDTLWDGDDSIDKHRSYLSNLFSDLQRVLRDNNCEEILLRRRGQAAIDRNKVDCDYFDLLRGIPGSEKRFHGEYMNQYSWGEYTLAKLIARENSREDSSQR